MRHTTSERGEIFLAETSLADKLRELSSVKLKKATVKIPAINAGEEKFSSQKSVACGVREKLAHHPTGETKPNAHVPSTLSSIVNILIKAVTPRVKKNEIGGQSAKAKPYKLVKDDESLKVNFGYAVNHRSYEKFPSASYADYKKIFRYLGWFSAKAQHEHMGEEHVAMANKSLDDSRSAILNSEIFDKATSHIKYFSGGYVDTLSLVPKAGMNSAEWEQFRLGMKLDPVLYGFKTGRLLRF